MEIAMPCIIKHSVTLKCGGVSKSMLKKTIWLLIK